MALIFLQSGPIAINTISTLGGSSLQLLLAAFESVPQPVATKLGGRRIAQKVSLQEFGSVVVKHYARGGILGRILSTLHLRLSSGLRARREFEFLEKARELGIKAPQPLVYAWSGSLVYRNWLVTKEIEGAMTLAELSINDEKRARAAIDQVLVQLNILIENGIFHVDLHPGNVLVDREGTAYLLDFDKARKYKRAANELRDNYLHRWRRATIKHELPEFLAETVSMGLRHKFA